MPSPLPLHGGWGAGQQHYRVGTAAVSTVITSTKSISAEDIFAYVYAMLHDPAYRQRYEVDLRRDFPRVYFQDDFAWWAQQGRALLDFTWSLRRRSRGRWSGSTRTE